MVLWAIRSGPTCRQNVALYKVVTLHDLHTKLKVRRIVVI